MLPRLFVVAAQIQDEADPELRVEEIGRTGERLAIERERFVLFALAVELLRLLLARSAGSTAWAVTSRGRACSAPVARENEKEDETLHTSDYRFKRCV